MSEGLNRKDIDNGASQALDKLTEGFNKLLSAIQKNDAELKEYHTSIKKVTDAEIKGYKAQVEAEKALQASNRTVKTALQNDAERIRVEKQLLSLQTQQAREQERLEKVQKRRIEQAKRENNEYFKLSKRTRDLKNQAKDLAAQMLLLERNGKKNTKEFRSLASQYNVASKNANKFDKQLKNIDARLGDNFRNVGNYKSALGGLKSAFTTIAGGFGAREVIRSFTGAVVNFDKAVTDLGAISGKTSDELKPLNEQARRLGETTQFSATEVTNLQIELAKLGFTTDEILNATGGIADFAAATGADIPRAAALGGSALRAFGLDATEIDRVVSTLGVATTKTALNFEFLETGLSTVAPVAKTFGFSIEETTALLGQLANSGFDASSAATATRNILLNLADSNGALAQSLGRPVTNINELSSGLLELQDRGIDLAGTLELTDKRSVAAFNTFIQGAGDLSKLTGEITDVNDLLQLMADKRLDSVDGRLKILNSAWEGYILNTSEANNTTELLKDTLEFITLNLPTIINYVLKAGKYFLLWRLQVGLLGKDLKRLNLGNLLSSLRNLPSLLSGIIKGFKAGSISARGFGNALKSIPLFAVIGLVTELVSWIMSWGEATEEQTQKESDLNDQLERGNEARKLRAQAETDIVSRVKQLGLLSKKQTKDLIEDINNEIRSYTELQSKIDKVRLTRQQEQNELSFGEAVRGNAIKDMEANNRLLEDGVDMYTDYNGKISELESFLRLANEQLGAFKETTKEVNNSQLKSFKDELKVVNEELESYTKITTDPNDAYLQQLKNRAKELQINIEKIEKLISLKEGEDKSDEEKLKKEREDARVRQELSQERLQGEINALEGVEYKEDEYFDKRKQKLIEQARFEMDNEDLTADEILLIDEKLQNDLEELERERLAKQKELREQDLKEADDLRQKEIEAEKAAWQKRTDVAKAATEEFNNITQSRIDNINEEMSVMDQRYQALSSQIEAGVDTYGKSLAEIDKAKSESLAKREQLEKRQRLISAFNSTLDTYNAILQGQDNPDPKKALFETAANVPLLAAIGSQLVQSFDVGTDNTSGEIGMGWNKNLDGKGGFLSMLHPNEMILNSDETSKAASMGLTTREQLLEAAKLGVTKPFKYEAATDVNSYDFMRLEKEMQKGFKKFENVQHALFAQQENTKFIIEKIMQGDKVKSINRFKP